MQGINDRNIENFWLTIVEAAASGVKMNEKPIKVLLIEDNPGDVRLIQEILKDAGSTKLVPEHADRLSSGLGCIAKKEFDVMLLDLGLPDSQGLHTLTRTIAQTSEIPILVLTGHVDEMVGVKAVQEGAQDYLPKHQLNSNLLIRDVTQDNNFQRITIDKNIYIQVMSNEKNPGKDKGFRHWLRQQSSEY